MRRIQVYIVLPPRVLLLDVAGPLEVLRRANQVQSALRFDVHYVGAGGSVRSSIGLALAAIEPLPEALPPDAWVVVAGDVSAVMAASDAPVGDLRAGPGSNGCAACSGDRGLEDRDEAGDERAIVAWLRTQVRPETRLICICSGALLAGRAGLLDGRTCTTHHESCAELAAIAPSARVVENRLFVADGPCCTSAGITTGIDLMLHVVGELTDQAAAAAIARYLVVYLRRGGADPQLSPWLEGRNHVHPAVHRAQDAIAADLTRTWSLSALARVASVSNRHLSRLFNEHVGMSIAQYVNRLRVARARELLSQTKLGMEQVAERTGFGSARQFRRAWRRVHEGTPSDARGGAAT